ncbi:helix-turn-helix domain-containing protein [Rhodanobacter denitrificans]|nr:helix-turn-helix domain-containing protein [Rhodanobacter denitrificans]
MDPAFSRRGEPATAFERNLVTHCGVTPARSEQELWLDLARRVDLDALFAILDEMGGRKAWVPTRETFVRLVWSAIRDSEIRRLHAGGNSFRSIASQLGIAPRTVTRVMHRRPFSATPKRAKQRA